MSDQPGTSPSDDDLQFDRVEETHSEPAAVGVPCAGCQQPIEQIYYEINGQTICLNCRTQLEAQLHGGSGVSRFLRALLFGIIAMIACAIGWHLIARWTGYQLGIVAIVVGAAVGIAVRKGSQGRGGVGYQLLAVALTYLAIAVSHVPAEYRHFNDEIARMAATEEGSSASVATAPASAPTPAGAAVRSPRPLSPGGPLEVVIILILCSLAALAFPLGFQSIFGYLILGIALWEAWKVNRPARFVVNGPFQLGEGPGGAAPGATVSY